MDNTHLSIRSMEPRGFVRRIAIGVTVFALAGVAASCRQSPPSSVEERPDFGHYFEAAGTAGTFVLYDPTEEKYLAHDLERANQRFIPASTFKILNSLIALETGVVADTLDLFEWDGVERSVGQWNRDHTLATAFEYSVVWVYQRIAREIGESRMRDFVMRSGYGNADIDGGIDTFWLAGDLRISPMEQIRFLRRLHERSLPFAERSIDIVEGIMVEDRGPGYVLYAKSGLADETPHDVGWYVGFVTGSDSSESRTYYFALEMDIDTADQISSRRGIARSILADLDIL
ncbi:MAG: class D beta-lactamase [Rhodothermales bacterium]|nr:class D beta-lactamase [Rhodothermales bacterium]